MYVCLCHGVSDKKIKKLALNRASRIFVESNAVLLLALNAENV